MIEPIPLPDVPVSTLEQLRSYAWKHEIAEKLELSRIPTRYRYEVQEWNPGQKDVFQACVDRFTGTGAIIALIGERGTGKTTIAAQLIIKRLWEDWERLE